ILDVPLPDGPMRCRCFAHAQKLLRRGTPVRMVPTARVRHERQPFLRERIRQGSDVVAACWVDPELRQVRWLRLGPLAAPPVVIPAYRAWTTLPTVLAALRPQIEGRNREAIIVDSSGDGRAADLARATPWARVIALPERALPGAARNVAYPEARGELIAFTDAD